VSVTASTSRSKDLAVLLAVASLAILAGLGNGTFWEPDEPRFAEATRQMFVRDDFLTPYLNGAPRFEKPILFYWTQAAALAAFGDNEFSARLPSAVAGIGIVLLLYLIGAQITSRRAALIAGLVTATMFRFVTFARIGLTDIPVIFFVVAALYGFIRAVHQASSAWALVAWMCVGLGVLTKGPVGVLPVAIWATYAVFIRDWSLVARIRPLIGGVLALAIALPWYVVMALQHGRAFTDFAIGHEMVERVLSEESFGAPARGFFYYFKVWPGDAAPWSALLAASVGWIAWRWSSVDRRVRHAVVFAAAWFLCVFLLFSLSRSKVPHYVLPAYPAAALLIGIFVDCVANTREDALWWRVPMAIVTVALLVLAALLAWSIDVLMPDAAPLARWLVPVVFAAGAVAVGVSAWRARAVSAAAALAVTLAAAFAVIGVIVIPGAVEAFKPMPRLARTASPVLQPNARIGLLGRYGASSLIYYSGHNVEWLLDDDAAVTFAGRPHAVCVMPAEDYRRLAPRLPPTMRVIDSAEEFNVRIERLLDRQRTHGRQWVLLAGR